MVAGRQDPTPGREDVSERGRWGPPGGGSGGTHRPLRWCPTEGTATSTCCRPQPQAPRLEPRGAREVAGCHSPEHLHRPREALMSRTISCPSCHQEAECPERCTPAAGEGPLPRDGRLPEVPRSAQKCPIAPWGHQLPLLSVGQAPRGSRHAGNKFARCPPPNAGVLSFPLRHPGTSHGEASGSAGGRGSCGAHRPAPPLRTPATLSHLGARAGPALAPIALPRPLSPATRAFSVPVDTPTPQPALPSPPGQSALSLPLLLGHAGQNPCPVPGGAWHQPAQTPARPETRAGPARAGRCRPRLAPGALGAPAAPLCCPGGCHVQHGLTEDAEPAALSLPVSKLQAPLRASLSSPGRPCTFAGDIG